MSLISVPETLRTPERCLLAVKQDGRALFYVPKTLRTPELCLLAVKQNGWAMLHVPKELKTPELCLLAVKQDGAALVSVPEALRTPELCLLAVKQNGQTLCYVPETLRTPELCLLAIKQSRQALYSVPVTVSLPLDEFTQDRQTLLEQLQHPRSDVGLCGTVERSQLPMLSYLMERWPKYSGDATYPVPAESPEKAYIAARGAGTLWSPSTEYGALRIELHQWLIQALKSYTLEEN